MVVYAVDRPYGSVAAGLTVIAAGAYEFTPLKQQFRRRCRDSAGSGFGFGRRCAGSSIGLMAMLVALGAMSIPLDGGDHHRGPRPEGPVRQRPPPCPADTAYCRAGHPA